MPPLLTIKNLHTHFFLDEGVVRAVDGVDLEIPRGKTLCVVGESGCGKSITAFSLLQMIQRPGRIVDGSLTLHRDSGTVELTDLAPDGDDMRRIRGDEIAMKFQEPKTSLSPASRTNAFTASQRAFVRHSETSCPRKGVGASHSARVMLLPGRP